MVAVAQLVRAPDCGSGGRGFETHLPPFFTPLVDKNCSISGFFIDLIFKLFKGHKTKSTEN